MKDVDSWKQTGYETRFRVNKHSTNISQDTDTLYKRPFNEEQSQSVTVEDSRRSSQS
jgi:hypothetical protein